MSEQEIGLPKLIQDIIALAETNIFPVGGDTEMPVAENEKVITVLTPFEKACRMLIGKYNGKAKAMIDTDVPMKDDAIQRIIQKTDMINRLTWFFIRERLGENSPKRIGIRNGWQVVEIIKEEDECDCPSCQMALLLGGGVIFNI